MSLFVFFNVLTSFSFCFSFSCDPLKKMRKKSPKHNRAKKSTQPAPKSSQQKWGNGWYFFGGRTGWELGTAAKWKTYFIFPLARGEREKRTKAQEQHDKRAHHLSKKQQNQQAHTDTHGAKKKIYIYISKKYSHPSLNRKIYGLQWAKKSSQQMRPLGQQLIFRTGDCTLELIWDATLLLAGLCSSANWSCVFCHGHFPWPLWQLWQSGCCLSVPFASDFYVFAANTYKNVHSHAHKNTHTCQDNTLLVGKGIKLGKGIKIAKLNDVKGQILFFKKLKNYWRLWKLKNIF